MLCKSQTPACFPINCTKEASLLWDVPQRFVASKVSEVCEESFTGMQGVERLITERMRRINAPKGLVQLFTTVIKPPAGPFPCQLQNTDVACGYEPKCPSSVPADMLLCSVESALQTNQPEESRNSPALTSSALMPSKMFRFYAKM